MDRVYRIIDNNLTLIAAPFTETWSPERRREKAKEVSAVPYLRQQFERLAAKAQKAYTLQAVLQKSAMPDIA